MKKIAIHVLAKRKHFVRAGVKGSFSPGSEQRYEQMCFNHENGKIKYALKMNGMSGNSI